jgi:hypothetical protein
MTYFEQACHRQAIALWQQRPDFQDWHARIFCKILRYSDTSSRPTSSASIVLLGGVAAAGADAYRSKAPVLSEWKRSISSEPQILNRMVSDLFTKAQEEIRLHRDIVARLTKWNPQRVR